MKIKMVSYYVRNSPQIFATFEYQKIKFDMFKNIEEFNPIWDFIEDEDFLMLKKIVNLELLRQNCLPHLTMLDAHLRPRPANCVYLN